MIVIGVVNHWAGTGKWFDYTLKTSIQNGDKEHNYFTFGRRGDDTAAVWNSNQVAFPCHSSKEIRAKVDVAMERCSVSYFVAGYR